VNQGGKDGGYVLLVVFLLRAFPSETDRFNDIQYSSVIIGTQKQLQVDTLNFYHK
jgi:hypothetical protein